MVVRGPRGDWLLLLTLCAAAAADSAAPLACEALDGDAREVVCQGRLYRLVPHTDRRLETSEAPHKCSEPDLLEPYSTQWMVCFGLALLCIVCAATAAGLTLGLTSMDGFQLKVLCNQEVEDLSPRGPPAERKAVRDKLRADQASAASIIPLISGRYSGPRSFGRRCLPRRASPTNAHYLLVTLLICNAGANEALPVVLDRLVPTWAAVLLSVTVVLVFGEIIPSALFTGPNQLALAARFARLVGLMKFIMLPIALPISLVLDILMHTEETDVNRAQIKAMVRTMGSPLEGEEAQMISGILDMHRYTCEDIGTRLSNAKMLPDDTVITRECIETITKWGHSRILLYRRDPLHPDWQYDIVGVLLVRKLLGASFAEPMRVDKVPNALRRPTILSSRDTLLEALRKFQDGGCHIAIICDDPATVSAALEEKRPIPAADRPRRFCSMEDLIERILKEDIFDEVDNEFKRFHRDSSQAQMPADWLVGRGQSTGMIRSGQYSPIMESIRIADRKARRTQSMESSEESDSSEGGDL